MPIISDIKHIHQCRINLMVDIHRRPPPPRRRRPLRHHRLRLHPQHLHQRIEAMVLNLHLWNLIRAWSFLKLPFQLQPHARSHLEIVATMGWSISSIIMPNWLRALWFASRTTTTKCPDMQRTPEIDFCLFFSFFFFFFVAAYSKVQWEKLNVRLLILLFQVLFLLVSCSSFWCQWANSPFLLVHISSSSRTSVCSSSRMLVHVL